MFESKPNDQNGTLFEIWSQQRPLNVTFFQDWWNSTDKLIDENATYYDQWHSDYYLEEAFGMRYMKDLALNGLIRLSVNQ